MILQQHAVAVILKRGKNKTIESRKCSQYFLIHVTHTVASHSYKMSAFINRLAHAIRVLVYEDFFPFFLKMSKSFCEAKEPLLEIQV